jgi:hypothetical protein
MAFADPETITVNAVAQVLARTGYPGPRSSEFLQDDRTSKLFVSHDIKKRDRSLVRFSEEKVAADPYIPANNIPLLMSVSLVVDRPVLGFTSTEALNTVSGFLTWLTAGSNAKLIKFLAHEI